MESLPPSGPDSGPDSARAWVRAAVLTAAFAIVIGAVALFVSFSRESGPSLRVVGGIQSIDGDVEHRLPQEFDFHSLPKAPQPLHDREMIVTHDSSHAVVSFPGGTVLRLNEDSRFVPEIDPTRPEGVVGNLLEGDATVIAVGKSGTFRLFRNGEEINLAEAEGERPPVVDPTLPQAASEGSDSEGLLITATVPEETPAPAASPTSEEGSSTGTGSGGAGADVLSNDEIRRGLRQQTGLFQRCYLNHLHRSPPAAGTTPGGTITLSFEIQSNGKVANIKINKTTLQDTSLLKCITDVTERARFRPFDGKPIPVLEFPISLK